MDQSHQIDVQPIVQDFSRKKLGALGSSISEI